MIDQNLILSSKDIGFFSDASAAKDLGFGSILGTKWVFGKWEEDFIEHFSPSIEYLELYALYTGILTWQSELSNCRILVHCDNMAVVHMVNNLSSSCRNCMFLLQILVLNRLQFNRRIAAVYVSTKDNFLSDSLSRLQFKHFRKLGSQMNDFPEKLNESIWPVSKLWQS